MKIPLKIASLFLAVLLAFAVGSVASADSRSELTADGAAAQAGAATQIYWIDAGTGTIRRANSDGSGEVLDLITPGQPTSLAIDLDGGRLYWTDTNAGKIRWADLNDFSNYHDLYSSERPTNLALDAVNGELYWTDQVPGSIRRANADGTSPAADILVLEGEPTSLAFDPVNRDMYWTDGATGKIRRAKMDRSMLDPIDDLAAGLIWPDNLALDLAQGQMYWTEWAPGRVRGADLPLSGSSSIRNTKTLARFTSGLPTGLALDLTGGRMYWTNGITHTIQSSDLTDADFGETDVLSASDGLNAPQSIAVAATTEPTVLQSTPLLYWVDEEAQKIQRIVGEDGAQSVADLATSAQGLSMPGSIAVDLAGGKVYWTDDGATGSACNICRANLDGSGTVESLKAGLADPVGIALDLSAGYLYWADREHGAIYRSNENINQDGLQVSAKTLVSGLTKPYQIALDIANGHMYWTERGEGTSKIRRADLDGNNVEDLVRYGNPFGLALDPVAGKMYWTERGSGLNGRDLIARANLEDGQNVEVLINAEPYSLSGIAVDVNDGKIYWTDEKAGAILRTDPDDPNGTVETVVTNLSSPEGIAIASPYLDSTRLALTILYRTTGGPAGQWDNSDNWLSDAPLGKWYGVTTADELGENITDLLELDLSNNGLTGELPAVLGNLNQLESLDLSGNRLNGPIPEGLAEGLPVLKVLNVSDNRLSGRIPAQLGNQHLTRLDLSRNQLDGPIPEELGSRLVSLRRMDLSHNLLSNSIPHQLSSFASLAGCEKIGQTLLNQGNLDSWRQYSGNLDNLEVLDLSNNGLSDAIPPMLCSLANLQVLDLGHNRLRGTMPVELGKLAALRALRLNGQSPYNQQGEVAPSLTSDYDTQDKWWLNGAIPPELGHLANLEVLDLSHNRLEGHIPDVFSSSSHLGCLLADNLQFRDTIIAATYGQLGNLIWLDLSHNELSSEVPKQLCTLTALRMLDLSNNMLSKEIPQAFGNLSSLKWLDLSGNQLTGTIPDELGSLADLISLSLHDNELNGRIPTELANLSKLATLHINNSQLSECIPVELRSVRDNDLGKLGLTYCLTVAAQSDQATLTFIYNSTDGTNWNWAEDDCKTWDKPPEETLNEWCGVAADDETGRVIGLFLSGHGLKGTIPWALRDLSELQYLHMADNQLIGDVFALAGLIKLTHVDLRNNNLSGWIDPQLVKLAPPPVGSGSLERMVLHHNELTGCIPRGLEGPLEVAEDARRTEIIEEYARGWQIELDSKVAEVLGEIPLVSSVNLNDPIGLDNVFFEIMGHFGLGDDPAVRLMEHFIFPTYGLGLPPCPPSIPPPDDPDAPWIPPYEQSYETDLQALLSICTLYSEVDKGRCPWPNWQSDKPLQEWHGVHTEDSREPWVENWRDCNNKSDYCRVTRLELTDKGLTGSIPQQLGNLGQLKYLNLSNNNLSGKIPPQLGHLRNLYTLALNNNRLEGHIPAQLGNLKGGTLDDKSLFDGLDGVLDFYLQENKLTGTVPLELANIGYLRSVRIDPQREDDGTPYNLDGCLPSSVVLDSLRTIQGFAFDFVSSKIKAIAGKRTKKEIRETEHYQAARDREAQRVVDAENDRREGLGYDQPLDVFQTAQVKDAAGRRFDDGIDVMYSDFKEASGVAETLSKVVNWLKDKVLQFGGVGNFEDVAC